MRPLTETQTKVLEALRAHCRANVVRYRESQPFLYRKDIERIGRGDQASTFGLGCVTWRLGNQLGMPPATVLRTFKALELKGLVLREKGVTDFRPLYWWPVGLAAELVAELMDQGDGHA